MAYTKERYTDVEPLAPGMHFLRDPLECDQLGVTVVEAEAGWEGMEHDHAEDAHEEVYVLLDGAAEMEVDGETVQLERNEAVRVDPESSRRLTFHDDGRMVIAGAP